MIVDDKMIEAHLLDRRDVLTDDAGITADLRLWKHRADTHLCAPCQDRSLLTHPFSKTDRSIPKDSACLVPASAGIVSPKPHDFGQRSPLHTRFASPTNC